MGVKMLEVVVLDQSAWESLITDYKKVKHKKFAYLPIAVKEY